LIILSHHLIHAASSASQVAATVTGEVSAFGIPTTTILQERCRRMMPNRTKP